ncbi:hypothetical protein HPP92_028745 [Vanilla planifolia]|uniref:Uncharacterized protein n=1 Tax=Vanilla planifolia TaxID=51239 RepID=A0A835P703_VANPL|nr:hypothetical protein HPP92_028745 [Vanilla planifolia]KAG0446656.1 hypothetical protein HPP92_028734 [Vanilla planifolia]
MAYRAGDFSQDWRPSTGLLSRRCVTDRFRPIGWPEVCGLRWVCHGIKCFEPAWVSISRASGRWWRECGQFSLSAARLYGASRAKLFERNGRIWRRYNRGEAVRDDESGDLRMTCPKEA